MKLAERTFRQADQSKFASVTGDRNPMHMDALLARRTQAGAPVVHGIHLLLWALDSVCAAQQDLPSLRQLRAQFNKFVYVDECAEVVITQQRETGMRLAIAVDGAPRSKIAIQFGEPLEGSSALDAKSLEPIPLPQEALPLKFEQMLGRCGLLGFQMNEQDAAELFPAATRWLGPRRIAALAASTCLVGMVCPGLHSIYSDLDVHTCAETDSPNGLAFRCTEADPRFRSIDLEIAGGGLAGVVQGFARTPPVQQATMQSLAGAVGPAEFAGSNALIVGGSRGLGELTAKLLATGGAQVTITWQAGREDAERVAKEIRGAGGWCTPLAYDARKSAEEQLAHLQDPPTHVYYFATPAIFKPQAQIFSTDRLREFMSIYVDGFWRLSETLRARQPKLSVFYPSTVFVAERPEGMAEYAMAKAAGEVLCAEMNALLGPAHVTVSRLPKMLTDQSASVTAEEMADPLATMLPIVREVQSWPRQSL